MKVTCKTVVGATFTVECEGSETVAAMKQKVQAANASLTAEHMVTVFQGKVLADATLLADAGVTEAGFVVVMVKKPAAAPAKPEAKPAAEPTAAPAATAPAAPAAPPAADAAPAAVAALPSPTDAYSSAASNLVAGTQLEATISGMMEMGFEREQVVRALRAAFNNPDRAVEYLMNGIPAGADVPPPAPAAAVAPQAVPAAAAAAAPGAGPNAQPLNLFPEGGAAPVGGGGGNLDALRNHPQFQAIRAMIAAQPNFLGPMLQELGKQNPQLLQLINANQEEFMALINEPVPEGGFDVAGLEGMFEGEGEEGEGEEGAPMQIAVTPEDQAAIERLAALGFDRNMAIQAFFACDKNEELAANFLFESGGD